jgi:hypothetical protein
VAPNSTSLTWVGATEVQLQGYRRNLPYGVTVATIKLLLLGPSKRVRTDEQCAGRRGGREGVGGNNRQKISRPDPTFVPDTPAR